MTTTAVFIGRFQPYHNGHAAIVARALREFDNVVILVGSAFQRRSRKNPWLWNERVFMIVDAHPDDEHRIYVAPLLDYPGDDEAWQKQVAALVSNLAPKGSMITLVGHRKDASSFYLDLFPKWGLIEWPSAGFRDGAAICADYFNAAGAFEPKIEDDVPTSTLAKMQQCIDSRELDNLRAQIE